MEAAGDDRADTEAVGATTSPCRYGGGGGTTVPIRRRWGRRRHRADTEAVGGTTSPCRYGGGGGEARSGGHKASGFERNHTIAAHIDDAIAPRGAR